MTVHAPMYKRTRARLGAYDLAHNDLHAHLHTQALMTVHITTYTRMCARPGAYNHAHNNLHTHMCTPRRL